MEQRAVIDETFAGLSSPAGTFEMGRPDITENRPGAALVAEVHAFEQAGGFRQIAEARDAERTEGDRIDAAAKKGVRHADLGIVAKGTEQPTSEGPLTD
jgi:hypothetical protein